MASKTSRVFNVQPNRRPDPTEAEIQSRAAEINRSWSPGERAKRMCGGQTVPVAALDEQLNHLGKTEQWNVQT